MLVLRPLDLNTDILNQRNRHRRHQQQRNGECAFIYKVIDREGGNYRAFFTPEWELLPFQFTSKAKYKKIEKPIAPAAEG